MQMKMMKYNVYTKGEIYLGTVYATDMMRALIQADTKWGESVNEIREDKTARPETIQ